MISTNWNFLKFDKEQALALARELKVSALVTGLLLNRGLKTAQEMRDFLFGASEPYHDPFLMKDLEKAARRILRAIAAQEQITVYGDYDVDGITATSLMLIFLKRLGARVNTYIPRRKSEGYGLNAEALRCLSEQGTSLVVTVDCGISCVSEVASAPDGMEIIITDHHTPPEILPNACALVNPKQKNCAYPFKGLSGVGVAFKLCQALWRIKNPAELYWEDLTELVAMGTVADIVPLRGENRELVRRGLAALERSSLVGLQALMEVSGCPRKNITSENIGFILAPRLNAVGRLEHAQRAVELLTTQDRELAETIAHELNDENRLRQEISLQIQKEAEELLSAQKEIKTAIVLAKEGWHQGVVGIVASRLVDRYHLPTILISIDGEMAKGSCRSIPKLNLYAAIDECADLLTQYGGHHQAAGLTLKAANVSEFRRRFMQIVARTLKPEDYNRELDIDLLLDGQERLSIPLLRQLEHLEPFGCENIAPVFAVRNMALRNPQLMGTVKKHLRFYGVYMHDVLSCIRWNGASEFARLERDCTADVAFMPRINNFRGEEQVQLDVKAIRQELTIYDYRQRERGREELLRGFLRRTGGVQLYRNSGEAFPQGTEEQDVCLKYYGEIPDAQPPVILCYDLPESGELPLPSGREFTLALLYTEEEMTAERERTLNACPDREHLIAAYRFLEKILRERKKANEQLLLRAAEECGAYLTKNALAVFAEIGLLKLAEKNFSLPWPPRKCNLEDSETYRRLRDECAKRLEAITRAMETSPADLRTAWEQLRGNR